MIKTFIVYTMLDLAINTFFDKVAENFAVPNPDSVVPPLHCGDIIDIYLTDGNDYAGVEYMCCYGGELLVYAEAYDYQMIKINLDDIESIEIIEEFVDEDEPFVDFLDESEDCLE